MVDADEVKRRLPMTVSHTNPGQVRPAGDDQPGAITRIGPRRRMEAIERLVGTASGADRAAAERFLHYAKTNGVSLEGLWSRVGRGGRILHSVLAVPSPGRTAMVFASHPASAAEVPALGGLIDHVCRCTAGEDLHLAQSLLDPRETLDRDAFLAAGFLELARLSYLERPIARGGPPPLWPDEARTETYRPQLQDILAGVLEQTYERTLDCPGLYGLRQTSDIIAGHMATGQFEPGLWTLLRLDGRFAGAILLNPFPDHRTVELVYLGLAPFARGGGLGRRVLRPGLGLLEGRRERTVTLAVDQRNAPALALYDDEGFRPVVDRIALIRSLRRADSGD